MTWTTERPQRPGWYWFRNTDYDIRMVHVVHSETALVEEETDGDQHELPDGEWAGPLAPPEDAPAPTYLDRIALSQSVRECSAVINEGLADTTLTIFAHTKIQDIGKARIVELRKK